MSYFRITLQKLSLLLVCWGGCVGSISADLVSVEYFDSATNPMFGGPLWTGVVDTVTNKLRLDTWTELPLHSSPEFWVPAGLPLIWNAVDATGAPFDVPDSFGEGNVVNFGSDAPENAADDFAFISPVTMQSLDWHPFDPIAGEPDTSTIVNFTSGVPFFPGWGGYSFIHPVNGLTFLVKQPNASSADEFDYRSVPALPTSAQGVGASTAATVTVTNRVVTNVATIIAVPEASAFWGLALVVAVGVSCGCTRRKLARA